MTHMTRGINWAGLDRSRSWNLPKFLSKTSLNQPIKYQCFFIINLALRQNDPNPIYVPKQISSERRVTGNLIYGGNGIDIYIYVAGGVNF